MKEDVKMINNSNKIFSKDFIQLFIINITSMLTFYSLMVSIVPYTVDEYHASTSMAGLVAGITVIGTLISRFISGYLISIILPKKILVFGMVFLIPVLLIYHLKFDIQYLLLVRFLQGLSVGLVGTVTNTIVVFIIPGSRRSEGISYFSMSTIIATAIGPFFSLLLIQYVDYSILFWIELVIGIIGFIFACMVNKEVIVINDYKLDNKDLNIKAEPFLNKFLEPKVFGLALLTLFVTFTYASLQSDLDLFAQDINIGTFASFFFLVYAGVILLSRPFTGRVMDIKNESYIIYPSLIILAIGMLLVAFMHSGYVLLIAAIFIGLGYGNFQSTIQSTIAKAVCTKRLGQANSTYFIFFDLALGIGPYLLGILVSFIGFRFLFLIMFLIALLGIPFYYFVHGNKVKLKITN
ncbi:MAG: MFS transporter [Bacilli bacterium]|jgi:MFS family permease|nr:MFS transporter [Bacilli bacterium]